MSFPRINIKIFVQINWSPVQWGMHLLTCLANILFCVSYLAWSTVTVKGNTYKLHEKIKIFKELMYFFAFPSSLPSHVMTAMLMHLLCFFLDVIHMDASTCFSWHWRAWNLDHDTWTMTPGPCHLDYDIWTMTLKPWHLDHDTWTMTWTMTHDPWHLDHELNHDLNHDTWTISFTMTPGS